MSQHFNVDGSEDMFFDFLLVKLLVKFLFEQRGLSDDDFVFFLFRAGFADLLDKIVEFFGEVRTCAHVINN